MNVGKGKLLRCWNSTFFQCINLRNDLLVPSKGKFLIGDFRPPPFKFFLRLSENTSDAKAIIEQAQVEQETQYFNFSRNYKWINKQAQIWNHSNLLFSSSRTSQTNIQKYYNPSNYIKRNIFTTIQMASQSTNPNPSTNGSICRQNYHEECEAHINKQINMELYASYVYMSMAYYFERDDVALPGFHKYFKKASDDEREHAEKLMKYQNKRGGRIVLQTIAKPTRNEWDGPLEAITAALELEKTINQTLLDLHGVSGRHNDPHLADYLETEFLEEQVRSIKELSDHLTNLNRVGKGLGEFMYDKELCEES